MSIVRLQSAELRAHHRGFIPVVASLSIFLATHFAFGTDAGNAPRLDPADPHFRRPVAAGLIGQHLLCVANRRSGSVSLVDVDTATVVGEWCIGEQLSDLAVLPNQQRVLVTDDKRHELIALELAGNEVRVLRGLA